MRLLLLFLLVWHVIVLPSYSQTVSSLNDSTSVIFSQQLDTIYPDAAYSAFEDRPMELLGMWMNVLAELDNKVNEQGLIALASKQSCFLKLYFSPDGKVKQLFFRLEPPFVIEEKDMKKVLILAVRNLSSIPHTTAYRQTGQWVILPKKSS